MKDKDHKAEKNSIIKTGIKIMSGVSIVLGSFFIPACHKNNPGPKEVESTTAGTMTSGSAPVGTTSSTSTGTTSSTTSGSSTSSSSTTSGSTSGTTTP